MHAEYGAVAINDGNIFNKGNYRMHSSQGGIAINKRYLNDEFNVLGKYMIMYTDAGHLLNTIDGVIDINYNDSTAMKIMNGGTAINEGIINIGGDNSYGMVADGVFKRDNGELDYNAKSTAINNGIIKINENNSIGMIAKNNGLTINGGVIDVDGNRSIGMIADGTGALAKNIGTINVNGNNSTGMVAENGGTAINDKDGVINLNGNDGIGIHVKDAESTYVNNGEINIKSGTGNRDIVNDGSFTNNGSFKSDGDLDFDSMGDGKFIMGQGGTLEAESIKGDIYASGALAMGGFDDEYTTYKMLKTDNIEGDIISNSAMFDAELTGKDDNGYHDVILVRKDFNDVVSNSEISTILEDHYVEDGNKLKEDYYDTLKLISTEDQLDKATDSTFGLDVYPTFAKQTFDMIDGANRTLTDYTSRHREDLATGEVRAIVGSDYKMSELDSYSNGEVSGYETQSFSVYVGAEQQLNDSLRLGGVLTFAKVNNDDYKDADASREDMQYQGNLFVTYEDSSQLRFTSTLFGGYTNADMNRTITNINENVDASIDNYFVGLNNILSKRYDVSEIYIEPKIELNVTYLMQGDISENGDYGVDIDSQDSTSVEIGIGLALGKDFIISDGNKINLEIGVSGYAELADPYKDLKSRNKNLFGNEKVTINGDDGDDFYGDANLKAGYQTNDLLDLYVEGGYRFGNHDNGWRGSAGITFTF